MIPLWGKLGAKERGKLILARITEDPGLPESLRTTEALLLRDGSDCKGEGYAAVLRLGERKSAEEISLPLEFGYLGDGDIIRVQPNGEIRTLYRRSSSHNVLFFTERCNSRCLMCSQPPREIEDGYLIDDILAAIPLMARGTPELCITGGEPMLAGARIFDVVRSVKENLPSTALHMLSNGRLFENRSLAQSLSDVKHPDLMVGIPLYADVASVHEFVVQAKGAFDETIRGILNLAQVGIAVEIRFVVHKQTVSRMVDTARFIGRNFPFVSQVAFMGMEMTGFARTNVDTLWIDPFDYRDELSNAVDLLQSRGIRTHVYNHPLCLLPEQLWPFAKKSISDWKNVYLPVCEPCMVRDQCCGFFAWTDLRQSSHIIPRLPL